MSCSLTRTACMVAMYHLVQDFSPATNSRRNPNELHLITEKIIYGRFLPISHSKNRFLQPHGLALYQLEGRFLIHHERVITVHKALALGNMTPISSRDEDVNNGCCYSLHSTPRAAPQTNHSEIRPSGRTWGNWTIGPTPDLRPALHFFPEVHFGWLFRASLG